MASKKVKWMMGKVRWYDAVKGEGYIRSEDGHSFYVNEAILSSLKNSKKLKKDTTKQLNFDMWVTF